ncbi:MAG TPA: SDR family oxidoreductase [Niabella sp.]|nr:SDR family oxidoreductase [Niabella sp.]
MKRSSKKSIRPKQSQQRPGRQNKLKPVSETYPVQYPLGRLQGKVAIITGGDSGIGKAVALLFAAEGADILIAYLNETEDARQTQEEVMLLGRKCVLVKGDLGKELHCKKVVEKAMSAFGQIDVLVNNAALHWEEKDIRDIDTTQLMRTFHSDFFSYFWMCKFTIPYLKKNSCIINTASVVAYRGSPRLLDYAAAKGAVISFTRSLANNLVEKGIRVNAVAPGPVWTPLIASTFSKKDVSTFGSDAPMKRAGMPNEIAPSFLFLACEDSGFISGQVMHPNGGEVVNG